MTQLYHFVYVRTEPVYARVPDIVAYYRTRKQTRRQVAPDLETAVKRMTKRATLHKPQVQVTIESAHVYNHTTQTWERIALHDE